MTQKEQFWICIIFWTKWFKIDKSFFLHMVDTLGTTLCGGTRKKHSRTRDMIQKKQRLDVLIKNIKTI